MYIDDSNNSSWLNSVAVVGSIRIYSLFILKKNGSEYKTCMVCRNKPIPIINTCTIDDVKQTLKSYNCDIISTENIQYLADIPQPIAINIFRNLLVKNNGVYIEHITTHNLYNILYLYDHLKLLDIGISTALGDYVIIFIAEDETLKYIRHRRLNNIYANFIVNLKLKNSKRCDICNNKKQNVLKFVVDVKINTVVNALNLIM